MSNEPYRSADRVFWVVDNGSSHRGASASDRLAARWPNASLVHLPIHASWLNQVEIYFSVVQRKVLTPTDVASLDDLERRLLTFQDLYSASAHTFDWKFTRDHLAELLKKIDARLRHAA